MSKLMTLKDEVRHILETYPETRDSDEKLYDSYISRHGVGIVSVHYFLTHFNDYHVSDFESVTRCRRKLVEEDPALGPSEEIKELRYERQVEIYDWVKGNN